jgi:cytochrome c556
MPPQAKYGTGVTVIAAALTLAIASVAARAQQTAAGVPGKPIVPLAASTLADNPNAYYGEVVTVTAPVEATLSKLSFSLDQDKSKATGKDVLVLTRTLSAPMELNAYVTVIGEVVRFEPVELARSSREYALDLGADVMARYQGRPAILATAVITAAGVDVARRVPPPMSAEEQAHSTVMKQVGAANSALRKAIDGLDANLARENATVLKKAFMQTEEFWKAKRRLDAMTWAMEAHKLADAIDQSAAGARWDEVKASAGTLAQACQSCHAAYRERMDDGTYRIKR